MAHTQDFTLKGFRAGHATELAKLGRSLGEILLAGEWRTRAFLSYTDLNQLDEFEFMAMTIDESDGQ